MAVKRTDELIQGSAASNPWGGRFDLGSADAVSVGGAAAGDFFGEGLESTGIDGDAAPVDPADTAAKKKAWLANQGLDESGNQLGAFGAPGSPTGQGYQVTSQQIGASGQVGDIYSAPIDPTTGQPQVGAPVTHGQYTGGQGPSQTSVGGLEGSIAPGQSVENAMAAAGNTDAGVHVASDGTTTLGAPAGQPGAFDAPVNYADGNLRTTGLGGFNAQGAIDTAGASAVNARGLGSDVLAGNTLPGGVGSGRQMDALDAAMAFGSDTGGRQASSALGGVNQFLAQDPASSKAQLLLDQATQNNMSDALSLARSGRARDAGSQARALNVAQAQNAATGVDAARSGALLRAQEQADARQQQLQGLGLKANITQGLDTDTLKALGLGQDAANQLRTGNIAERGQTLDFTQGMQQVGAGLESDILKTIPQLEQVRHDDQFDLTPQQKLEVARIGNPKKTTADYVTGLLGDVLGAL